MTASAIYEGSVRHRRFAEHPHEFRYPLAMAYLDLDELPALLGGRLVAARPGLVRFRRGDYLGGADVPLGRAVEELVGAPGPVRLLTQLRSFGHCFNPVSFYYCFEPDSARPAAVVAEVTNTPWAERHAYVMRASQGTVMHTEADKALHVSPFMAMDHRYAMRFTAPGETLSVHIESRRADELAFDATLSLRRRPLTAASLRRLAAQTVRTVAHIYVQAIRLRAKGVTWHPHPNALPGA